METFLFVFWRIGGHGGIRSMSMAFIVSFREFFRHDKDGGRIHFDKIKGEDILLFIFWKKVGDEPSLNFRLVSKNPGFQDGFYEVIKGFFGKFLELLLNFGPTINVDFTTE